MDERAMGIQPNAVPGPSAGSWTGAKALPRDSSSFHGECAALFAAHYERLFRYVGRLSVEPDKSAYVVQEAFVKLYQRGSLPEEPGAWLISVAMNLFRNEKGKRSRRLRLLTPERGERTLGDPPARPDDAVIADQSHRAVRVALESLPERDRAMLLLQAEGYAYREIAAALEMNAASVGTLLARARRAFRKVYEENSRASR
jgi:RNA polymerase sigma-70 factor (ECF subfamily)